MEVIVLEAGEPLPVKNQIWFVDRRSGQNLILTAFTHELIAVAEDVDDAEYICSLHNQEIESLS